MKQLVGRMLKKVSGFMNAASCRILESGCEKYLEDAYLQEFDINRYPECVVSSSKVQTLKGIEERMGRCIEDGKLYLDPYMSLERLTSLVGSNRTYVSNVLSAKRGFKNYLNEFRFRHMYYELQNLTVSSADGLLSDSSFTVSPSDLEQIVLCCGFLDMRAFRRALGNSNGEWAKKVRGKIY